MTPVDQPNIGAASHADPVVRAGVARGRVLFNRGDFWGSHEALEAAWHVAPDGAREGLQGLIQAGAAFHKLVVQDNPGGAGRLLTWALEKLDPLPPDAFGLALEPFRAQLLWWMRALPDAVPSAGMLVGLPRMEWAPRAEAACMSVEAVRLYEVQPGHRRAVLVAVDADGVTGWGECRAAWERHGLFDSLAQTLVPALLAEPIGAPSEVGVVWSGLAVDPCAAAGLEAALWDLWSRRAGLSLAAALGIGARPVPLSARIGGRDVEGLGAAVEASLAIGFTHVTLPARPNADRRVLPGLAARCRVPFAIDLGAAYRPSDLRALQVLDALGATWLGQPVAAWNVADAITLCRWLATPVALGGWTSEEQAAGALGLAALDALLVDPGISGLTEAARIAELAAGRDRPLAVTSSAATPVGLTADLALAAHPAASLPAVVAPPDRAESAWADLWAGPPPVAGGVGIPAGGSGLGIAPDAAALGRLAVRFAVFTA